MQRFWLLGALVAVTACVEDAGEPAADDNADGGVADDNDGGNLGSDAAAGDWAVDAAWPDEGTEPDVDAPPPPPPPPPEGQGCDAYCARLDECFAPACPPLDGNTRQLCRAGCRGQGDATLREWAQLECDAFNDRIFATSDQLARFCDDSIPPPEGCDAVCDLAEQCGAPGGREGCLGTCRAVGKDTLECLRGAQNCMQFGRCFQRPPMPPDDGQRCQAYCGRQAQCVFLECAAGTLPDGFNDACQANCRQDPPPQEEMAWVFEQLCPDVVVGVRQRHDEIDARCENDEDEVCELLCRDTIGGCDDGFDQDECEAECADFDEPNLVCLQVADDCGEVNACFGDPEGQARCTRFCEHLQGCLEEACPPRVIPPPLSVNCTAGCLDDPPEEMALGEWEALSCREVRQTVYRRNRELRPICEGGRDFRPTPEECTAFCDNGLQACIGVGGRNFCLAACASLTRDQYACALEAQGDCGLIGECLAPDEE